MTVAAILKVMYGGELLQLRIVSVSTAEYDNKRTAYHLILLYMNT